MYHFPQLRLLIFDMKKKHNDREHYTAKAQDTIFDIIICLDRIPHEVLIGGQGINWACSMELSDEFEMSMDDDDFYELRKKLNIKKGGAIKFGSYIFMKTIFDQSPKQCSGKPVQPNVMKRWYRNRCKVNNPEEQTVFYRWVDQTKSGHKAHNFDKTELYFGRRVADYCRRNNISSQWITEEQAEKMHIGTVKYPWM